jgi:hypothetical protein
MCMHRTLVLVATAAVVVAALALPATAESRQPSRVAGWEVLPAPAGQIAEPWSRGDVTDGGAVSPQAVLPWPQEMLRPMPDAVYHPTPMPVGQRAASVCDVACGCPQPRRIEYRDHRRPPRKGEGLCVSPIHMALLVPNPLGCQCAVEIPVCVPACCSDAPQVEARRGLLGRTRLRYRWCCGFEIEVVICGNGDWIVHYAQR